MRILESWYNLFAIYRVFIKMWNTFDTGDVRKKLVYNNVIKIRLDRRVNRHWMERDRECYEQSNEKRENEKKGYG